MTTRISVVPISRLVTVVLAVLLLATLTLPGAGNQIASAQTPAASPESSPTNPGNGSPSSTKWTVASSRDIKVDGQPVAISPDAKWIAGPGPDKDFCVWDVATLKATCGGEDLVIQIDTIRWAPDSSAVAFSLEAAKYFIDSDIYVFDVGKGELDDLTDDGNKQPIGFGTPDPQAEPVYLDIYPSWSPDSSQLLFARSDWSSETRGTTLMTIGRDGGEPETLFALAPPEPLIIYSPMYWLADDSILFSVWHADPENEQNGLWQRTSSGQLTQILKGDTTAEIPTPRVTSISSLHAIITVTSAFRQAQYAANAENPVFFFVALPSRSAATQIVEIPAPKQMPSAIVSIPGRFSADGNTLVFAVRDGGEQQLAIVARSEDEPTYIPFDQMIAQDGYTSGLSLVAGNTLFIPTGESGSGTGVILTLTPPDPSPTPIPPCGCSIEPTNAA